MALAAGKLESESQRQDMVRELGRLVAAEDMAREQHVVECGALGQ